MSLTRDIVDGLFDGIKALVMIKRDPCRVTGRKERALIRASLRRYPNKRRIARLGKEWLHWSKECSNKRRREAAAK